MTGLALSLVLTAAFCHATWNFLLKRVNGGPELAWLFSAISTVLYLPVGILVYVHERPEFDLQVWFFTIGSAVLHMAYFLFLQHGYRKGDLSLVYPTARATGPLLSAAFAVAVLGEHLTWPIAIGGVAIIVGVVFLTGGFRRGAENARSSIIFGLAAGTLIGSYTIWDAYTVRHLHVPPVLLDYASMVLRTIVLAPYAYSHRADTERHWRDHRWSVIGIAVFNPLAYILVLTALAFTPVVYVAPAREVSVLITVLMGTLLLGEGAAKSRFLWACLILAGMTVLALG